MASFSDKITVVIDVATEKATRGMKDFKSSVKEAEGFTGKLKAGVGSLGSQFKSVATSPAALAGGVAALGAGAMKAVDEFAALGIEVGKFSDATGVAAEDASRLIEVAGDVGIEVGSLQTAMGKLNKSIDPEKFRELGIEIAKTADGATDVNGTFLNVIDKLNGIKDPAERAKLATKLLGKGWQDMAELIGQGSAALSKSLSEVSDAKVIDAAEVQKARDYRAAMDKLNDAFQDMMITVGEELAPAVSKAADDFADLIGILRNTNDGLEEVADTTGVDVKQAFMDAINPIEAVRHGWEMAFGDEGKDKADAATESMDEFTASTNKGRGALNEWNPAAKKAQENTDKLAEATREAERATKDYDRAYRELLGQIDQEEAWANLSERMWAFRDGLGDSGQEARDLKRDMIDMIAEMDNIPKEKKTKLLTMIDRGALDEVYRELGKLQNSSIVIPVRPVGSGMSTIGGGGKRASGGQVQAGVPYTVGEQGTEMFVPNTNGVVVPHGALNAGGGGGGVVVNLYPRTMPTERELIDLINGIRRKQGGVI